MSSLDHFVPDGEPNEQFIEYRRMVRYPQAPDVRIPQEAPSVEIRPTGLFGGPDRQDREHEKRMRRIYHKTHEAAYFEQLALAFEVHGTGKIAEAVSKAETIVYSLRQESVAAQVTADVAGDLAVRARLRHTRTAEALDAQGLNTIEGN